ncbi:recombinase family protein [Anaerosporobacter faecicola]|uniref:recombinase family protein n=1 Tax=Anaerosporobacter faecicola TaxID=2718714 RepID=UPI00143AD484|nr:recombinase family protein [Anaerosporobacter faecicola]
MKVAIYLRKSRGDEETSLEKHRMQLLELAHRNHYTYDVYEEIGSSDSITSRPEFTKLLDNIKKYNKVLVVALDRLSRNDLNQAQIINIFKENGVKVETPNRTYNFEEESDIITSDFEFLLARQEYRLIKKRLRQGKIEGAKQGNFVNGKPPLGYRFNSMTKEVEIDEDGKKIYRYIVDKVLSGEYSAYSMAFELNKQGVPTSYGGQWNNTGVYRLLLSEFHLGMVKYNNEWYQGRHEPLKTEEEHRKVLTMFNHVGKKPRKNNKRVFALSQLLKCHCCGHTLTLGLKKADNTVYVKPCWYRDPYGEKCGNYGMKQDTLMPFIYEQIDDHIEELKVCIESGQNKVKMERKNALLYEFDMIEQKRQSLNEKHKRILEMIESGLYTIADGKRRIDELNDQITSLQKRQDVIKYDIDTEFSKNMEDELLSLEQVKERLQGCVSEEQLNAILRSIIKQIKYGKTIDNEVTLEISYL